MLRRTAPRGLPVPLDEDFLEVYMRYLNYEYCRIDGNTGGEKRDSQKEVFNEEGSSKFVFLVSVIQVSSSSTPCPIRPEGAVGIRAASSARPSSRIKIAPSRHQQCGLQSRKQTARFARTCLPETPPHPRSCPDLLFVSKVVEWINPFRG